MHKPQPARRRTFGELVDLQLLQELCDYIIPDLDRDLPYGVYITVELARRHLNPRVRGVYRSVTTYFEELDKIARRALAGDRPALIAFEERLNFGERAEAGLGYTRDGHGGSAVGNRRLAARLRDVLLMYPALRTVLTTVPDALQFVPLLAMDRISDIVLNIALRDFAAITQDYVKSEGFAEDCLGTAKWTHVWNADTRSFDEQLSARVPVDDSGRPILLVPKTIVRGSPALDSHDFIGEEADIGRGLSKEELLDRLGQDSQALAKFAMARLEGITEHRRFQNDTKRRRPRRRD